MGELFGLLIIVLIVLIVLGGFEDCLMLIEWHWNGTCRCRVISKLSRLMQREVAKRKSSFIYITRTVFYFYFWDSARVCRRLCRILIEKSIILIQNGIHGFA